MKALKIKCHDDKACVVFLFIYLRKLVTRDSQVLAKLGWGDRLKFVNLLKSVRTMTTTVHHHVLDC